MRSHFPPAARALMLVLALVASWPVRAEPYLAIQQGYRCVQCHVNPTGGGLRNDFGTVFTKTVLPVVPYPERAPNWTGKIFEYLRMGTDLRTSWSDTRVPGQGSQRSSGLEQWRVYANLEFLQERLGFYVDELASPGNGEELELYARVGNPMNGWYVKGGRFYLPFGWRLQDNTSFTRGVTGINMTTPDEGVELGFEGSNWSAQVDIAKNIGSADAKLGNQIIGQFVWVQPTWRAGAAASLVKAAPGNRRTIGLFAGTRTGKVSWLAEADLVRDAGYRQGSRSLVTLLGEANWNFYKGNNLKLTGEFFDPDRKVPEDAQTRWSLLYELTPVPFIQLRAGVRNYDGIPQSAFQNRRVSFVELHAFL